MVINTRLGSLIIQFYIRGGIIQAWPLGKGCQLVESYVHESVELPNHVVVPYLEKGDSGGIPLILLHGIADSMRALIY